MLRIPLIFIQIHKVVILSFQRQFLNPNVADIFGYLAPIYSVTISAEMKLIVKDKIDVCISAH